MAIRISAKTYAKLAQKHGVNAEEITQCFATCEGRFLEDPREEHRTDPPTLWFVSETYYGRMLKVVFIKKDGDIFIKSAFPPNDEEKRIYLKYGLRSQ